MTLLLTLVSFFLLNTDVVPAEVGSKHLGKWQYEVVSPDITYKGTLELAEADGSLTGALKSEGATFPLTDIELDGDDLTFKVNVQGFPCVIVGVFDGNSFKGSVEVEGLSMPMSATRM